MLKIASMTSSKVRCVFKTSGVFISYFIISDQFLGLFFTQVVHIYFTDERFAHFFLNSTYCNNGSCSCSCVESTVANPTK